MASLDTSVLKAKLIESHVPEHMHDGLVLWLQNGIQPGSFLRAVLENDLREACNRADTTNRYRLYDLVFFLYNYAPIGSWGSPENVQAWYQMNAETRQAVK